MIEAERRRMQHGAVGAAGIGAGPAFERPIIDAFAAQRGALFAQVNANLMRAARFQPAFDQREPRHFLKDAHMRYGKLARLIRIAAAPAIAPIGDEIRLDASFLGLAAHQSQVGALDAMGAGTAGLARSRLPASVPARSGRSSPCPADAPHVAGRLGLCRPAAGRANRPAWLGETSARVGRTWLDRWHGGPSSGPPACWRR